MAQVAQFSIWLPNAKTIVNEASSSLEGLNQLEASLLKQLTQSSQLLRWAFIRVENDQVLCEGAYLTSI